MLHRIQSKDIISYKKIIKDALMSFIPDCENKNLFFVYKNLLLDKYQLWVWHKDDKLNSIVITTINKDILCDDNIFNIFGIYAPDGADFNDWPEVLAAMKPFALKHKCTKYDFLMVNKKLWDYIPWFKPTLDARYCQVNL